MNNLFFMTRRHVATNALILGTLSFFNSILNPCIAYAQTRSVQPVLTSGIAASKREYLPPMRTVIVSPTKTEGDVRADAMTMRGVQEMLIQGMKGSRYFTVVDASGGATAAAKAQYTLQAVVTDLQVHEKKILNSPIGLPRLPKGLGGLINPPGGAGQATLKEFTVNAHVVVRLVDATTGVLVSSHAGDVTVKNRGVSLTVGDQGAVNTGGSSTGGDVIGGGGFSSSGSGAGVDIGAFSAAPLGKAVQAAINQAVLEMHNAIARQPWQASVVSAIPTKIVLNVGTKHNVQVDDTFTVWHPSEAMTDPVTGQPLGAEEERIGLVQVTKVENGWAEAKVVTGKGFTRGDYVRQP